MRKSYDFNNATKGPVLVAKGKTRITIMLDDDLLTFFLTQAESQGMGYQTLINNCTSTGASKINIKEKGAAITDSSHFA